MDCQPCDAGPPESSQDAARHCNQDAGQEKKVAGTPLRHDAARRQEQVPFPCIEAEEGGGSQPKQQPIPQQV